jgi:hypothetical protein
MLGALVANWRLVGAFVIVAALLGGAAWLHDAGTREGYAAGRAEVQAAWDAERLAALTAAAQAAATRDAAERDAAQRLRRLTDAHSQEIASRDAAASAVRGELARLRDALAGRAAGPRDLATPAPAGPPADADGRPGELLGACAGELARMGDDARALAAIVIGLQEYARIAQATCGVER